MPPPPFPPSPSPRPPPQPSPPPMPPPTSRPPPSPWPPAPICSPPPPASPPGPPSAPAIKFWLQNFPPSPPPAPAAPPFSVQQDLCLGECTARLSSTKLATLLQLPTMSDPLSTAHLTLQLVGLVSLILGCAGLLQRAGFSCKWEERFKRAQQRCVPQSSQVVERAHE